jgi:putative transposase
MNEDERNQEALFRHSILGELLSRKLRRGELRAALKQLAQQTYQDQKGRSRRVAYKTLEQWYYKYRNRGFEALKPRPRSDRGLSRVLSRDLEQLIVDMKREDVGRSARLILRELELAGRIRHGEVSVSVVQRLLRGRGLSGPQLELEHAARYRWEASMCGELWQADAMHGPMLMNPATGRIQRAIIFGLIDDRSRLIPYLEAGFGETEQRFLIVLYNAMARRGIVRRLLLDNHASFSGFDLRLLCARLSIHLVHSRPGDAPSKGKIERFWRTLRAQLVERLDLERVTSIDELNLRLWSRNTITSHILRFPAARRSRSGKAIGIRSDGSMTTLNWNKHSMVKPNAGCATTRPSNGVASSMKSRRTCGGRTCACVIRCSIPRAFPSSRLPPRFHYVPFGR